MAGCLLGPVKALPILPIMVVNPEIVVNGEWLVIPVTMESGMFLELLSPTDCKLYGPRGKLLQEVTLKGKTPTLRQGENRVSFSCDTHETVNTKVPVTVIGHGEPLVTE